MDDNGITGHVDGQAAATFIKNDDVLRRVRGLGLHYGQGFRLSQPQSLDTLTPAAVELDTGRIGGNQTEH